MIDKVFAEKFIERVTKYTEYNVNIMEVSQSIMQDLFAMIMLADISDSNAPFAQLKDELSEYGKQNALSVHIMHEDIFNSMHRI